MEAPIIQCGKCGALNVPTSNKALDTTAGGVVPSPRSALLPEAIGKIKTLKQTEDLFADMMLKILTAKKEEILAELDNIDRSDMLRQIKSIEVKDLTTELIAKLKAIMNVADTLSVATTMMIAKAFEQGTAKAGKELRMNLSPNAQAIDFIRTHVFDNVKDMTDELAADLRSEFERGLINREGPRELKKRVLKVFDVNEVRAEAIARTEVNRAFNEGTLDGYKQSGLEGLKEWNTKWDHRTSEICKRLDKQRVPLDAKFKDPKTGDEYFNPPAHVNCRSRIVFHPEPLGSVTDAEKKAITEWYGTDIGVSEQGRILGRPNKTVYEQRKKLELE